tara:strand:+ start:343 stop:645 length:303 start_codon:yes stop_codon:yes gene_type:complete
MATEISENTKLQLDLKTIGVIIFFTITLAGTYFTLQAQIQTAMEEPKPEISKVEFTYKDELVRSSIMRVEEKTNVLGEDVQEIKSSLEKIEQRLYEMKGR